MARLPVSFHPDRSTAYVSQLGTNDAAVIDMDRFAVIGGFGTGLNPDSSVLLPAGA
ncbi:hypothetical protein NGM36_35400 [Streptomyces mutabilis]|uniref:hypothetical protein n=1 Tax=Streptomyces mutabilis TaxID=67332 RepID=UPI0022BA71A6|nr:hypothetical protein [Streptomyces mutabilis]MCZ9354991.1 hypothetical protein [Streptomyces mutabilis]